MQFNHKNSIRLGKISSIDPENASTDESYNSLLTHFYELMHRQAHQDLNTWAYHLLEYLIQYFRAIQGVFYVYEPQKKRLKYLTGFANQRSLNVEQDLCLGESIAGQVAVNEQLILRRFQSQQAIVFQTGSIQIKAEALIAFPVFSNDEVCGVIEMIFYENPKPQEIDILKNLGYQIGSNLKIRLQEEELIQSNKILEQKNNMISSSIKYAQKVQEAILPKEESLLKLFSDYFVLFLPKDVVSGDFYWVSQLDIQISSQSKKMIMACVDCTGHGVAGALMSMVGNTLLNEIVNQKQIHDPSQIIRHLHQNIKSTLRQEETGNTDGMDLIICSFEPKEQGQLEMIFAGAKRNLILIKDQEIIELKGDRLSIGGNQTLEGKTVSNQTLKLNKGDLIYLSTDGYEDSANTQRKKFGYHQLKKLFWENTDLSLQEQKEKLILELDKHVGNNLQRDDITIIGLRV